MRQLTVLLILAAGIACGEPSSSPKNFAVGIGAPAKPGVKAALVHSDVTARVQQVCTQADGLVFVELAHELGGQTIGTLRLRLTPDGAGSLVGLNGLTPVTHFQSSTMNLLKSVGPAVDREIGPMAAAGKLNWH